ncbi:MAG: hypothetical protein J5757_09295 [Lachnospiraceae bacterium]|nr:hypothetical protein [Lachnospiraceae bacterium]
MFGNLLFAPEHTPDEVIRVSSSIINWQICLVVFLLVVLLFLFLYVRNSFSGYFMAILWGALGCYLYHQCFEIIVTVLRQLGLSFFIVETEGGARSLHPVAPFVSVIFVFLEAVVLVAWFFAFYKFFILLKQKPTMGSTVNVTFGYLFMEYMLYFVNLGISVLTATTINSKSNFAELTAKMDEEGIKNLDQYLEDISAYDTLYSLGSIITFISLIFFVVALTFFIHCYMSKKEAKPCFATAVMFVGIYLLWDRSLLVNDMGIFTPLIKLFISVVGAVFAVKTLKENCPEQYELFIGKFKKGPIHLFFHKTPGDKPVAQKGSNSKIASKASKHARVGNFSDLHKLDKKDKNDK